MKHDFYWPIVCNMVRPMLSDHCPVCDVGVLWPNGWMDQDETWHGGRLATLCYMGIQLLRPLPAHKRGTARQFLTTVHCGQKAGWTKMPHSMEVGLGPGDIVSDGNPAPLPKRGTAPATFRPMSVVAKWLDGSRCHLVRR